MTKDKYFRTRLLSALALLLLLVVFITGSLIIITNPGLTLLYAFAGVGVALGVWLMLSAREAKFWWGVVITVFALVIAIIVTGLFFTNSKNVTRLLILAGSTTGYLALVGIIARQYWQSRRIEAKVTANLTAKPVLIINPKSGDGRAINAGLADKARALRIETIVLQPGQDMVRLADDAIVQGANVIGISGGDGSLGVMAKVAMDHELPLVVLPGGTRCHFARDIGLDPARITDALAGFFGIERQVDTGLIGDRVFLNNASFGLYAEITSHKEYRAHKIVTARRVTRGLVTSDSPFYPLKFHDGEGIEWEHAAVVLVGVNRYEMLNLGELGERERLDEGVLQVVALRAVDNKILHQLTVRNKLGNPGNALFSEWTTTLFSIAHPSGKLNVGVDGESLQVKSPTIIRIMPKSLRLLVPAEGIRNRPIKPISTLGAKTLWQLISTKPMNRS